MKSLRAVVSAEACGFTRVTSETHPRSLLSVDNGHMDLRGCWVVEVA